MITGKMTYRVTLQKPINETNRRGIPSEYEDIDTVWASIRPIKTASQSKNQNLVIGSYEIRIWKNDNLDESCRIIHNDYIYNIDQVDIPKPITNEMVIIAKRNKHK